MSNYKIETNPNNGGLCCFFEHEGREYVADLCLVLYADYTECMIFAAKDGQVTSWADLYCKRNIPVTEQALIECIEFFKAHYKETD